MESKFEEQIINLNPELKARGEIQFGELRNNLEGKIYYCSSDSSKLYMKELGKKPMLEGFYKAYANHLPIAISPDMLWMLIVQAFSRHIEKNSEKLRQRFVNFDGKKDLVCEDTSNIPSLDDFKKEDWETLFKCYVNKIRENVGGLLIGALTPCFSTTTPTIQVASKIAIMSAFKSYFRFSCGCFGGCGFPYIVLQGSLMDYMQLKMKLESLLTYGIDDWINVLLPVIDKFIETKQGNVDKEFWCNILNNQSAKAKEGSDPNQIVEGVSGWLLNFYPYFNTENRSLIQEMNSEEISAILENLPEFFKKYYQKNGRFPPDFCYIHKKVIKLRKEFNNSLNMNEFNDLCDEIIIAPLNMKNIITNKEVELSCGTGFLGVYKDKNGIIKPEIGYYVREQTN